MPDIEFLNYCFLLLADFHEVTLIEESVKEKSVQEEHGNKKPVKERRNKGSREHKEKHVREEEHGNKKPVKERSNKGSRELEEEHVREEEHGLSFGRAPFKVMGHLTSL